VWLHYETAADFSGFDPGAMWEDFKVGMEHLTRWERVAVVTDVEWIKQTMRFSAMPGAMKSFPTVGGRASAPSRAALESRGAIGLIVIHRPSAARDIFP
jgi:hypothetical protein